MLCNLISVSNIVQHQSIHHLFSIVKVNHLGNTFIPCTLINTRYEKKFISHQERLATYNNFHRDEKSEEFICWMIDISCWSYFSSVKGTIFTWMFISCDITINKLPSLFSLCWALVTVNINKRFIQNPFYGFYTLRNLNCFIEYTSNLI